MSAIQYITSLLAAAAMYLIMAAYMAVAAGVGLLGAMLLFFPLLLFALSGLSFFIPRVYALLAVVLVSPSVYVGTVDAIYPTPASQPLLFLLPGVVVIFVSVLAFRINEPSAWSRVNGSLAKIFVLIVALLPALFTMWALVSFFSSVTFVRNS